MTEEQRKLIRATTRVPVRNLLSVKSAIFPDLDSPESGPGDIGIVIRFSEPDSPHAHIVILEPEDAGKLCSELLKVCGLVTFPDS